jgi:hypothetical protein
MAELAESVEPRDARPAGGVDRTYRLLQGVLLSLRAGPALILLLLITSWHRFPDGAGQRRARRAR